MEKARIDMADIIKPSVFEVTVKKSDKEKFYKHINETRLTKDFLKECAETVENLTK